MQLKDLTLSEKCLPLFLCPTCDSKTLSPLHVVARPISLLSLFLLLAVESPVSLSLSPSCSCRICRLSVLHNFSCRSCVTLSLLLPGVTGSISLSHLLHVVATPVSFFLTCGIRTSLCVLLGPLSLSLSYLKKQVLSPPPIFKRRTRLSLSLSLSFTLVAGPVSLSLSYLW